MMRSTSWITILVGLFMFQSLWNVAAAFCVHDEKVEIQQQYHFGHHQNTLCTSDNAQSSVKEHSKHLNTNSSDIQLGEDHHDHLPSMTHLIVQDQKHLLDAPHISIEETPKFHWKNDYQAPDLSQQSPPPEFSLLMVG